VAEKVKKADLWVEHKEVYRPSAREPELVKAPPLACLAVEGAGDPNTSADFRNAIGALYGIAYTAKFTLKKARGLDFRVMPLSGLFHADDPSVFLEGHKDRWEWTLMIAVPGFVTAADVAKARDQAAKRENASPALGLVSRRIFKEGLCAQILHRGPYAAEKPTIEKLHAFIREQGLRFGGSHHEIYVSDPNRTAPDKLKTIIRQPVRKA